jgi:tetratricopeptide (TPR) repeat protein
MTFSVEEIDDALNGMVKDKNILPLSIREQIYENSKGLPAYFEQVIMFLMQTGGIKIDIQKNDEYIVAEELKDFKLPLDTAGLLKIRLNHIAKMSANAFKVVCYASILGYKFLPVLVQNILKIPDQEFNEIIEMLLFNGIFNTFDKYNITFKNKIIWEIVYNLELNDKNKTSCYSGVNKGLMEYTKPNAAIIAENSLKLDLDPQYIIDYLEYAAQEAYSAGDDYAYTKLKAKILDYLEQITIENKENIKYGIYEELGKLNFKKNPNETINYLSEVIKYYEENNDARKIIDLSGYLAKSCEIKGNYAYALECTDKAIEVLDKNTMPQEYALLVYSKLEHLMNMGRLEELIILARTIVIPALEVIKNSDKIINGLELSDIKFIELDTRYLISKSLAQQGNIDCIKEAETLLNLANQNQNGDFVVKTHLIIAFFKALQGQHSEVLSILSGLKDLIKNTDDSTKNIIEWQFINTINNLLAKNIEELTRDLPELINFSINTDAYFYQPLFKGIWGKMLVENNEITKANDLYFDLIHLCSESKFATGALTLWYLIAEVEIKLQDADKALKVAEKALEVSQNPMINNYFFTMLFQKILAEVYWAKDDLSMASMYLEQAIQIAQKFDLTIWEVKLSLLCGNIFKYKAVSKLLEKTENVQSAYKMYLTALDLIKKVPNKKILSEIENSVNELSQFCTKEGINV